MMKFLLRVLLLISTLVIPVSCIFAQVSEPNPGEPRTFKVPEATRFKLRNGLELSVIERRNSPLVSVQMITNSGITEDDIKTAGLAQMIANLLTKGTKTRTATQIANEIDFLGASISATAGNDNTYITLDVPSNKLKEAMSVFSDVILNPMFKPSEIKLAKSQAIDELNYNLKQPGFLAGYVASVYSFYLTPQVGTPESIKALSRAAIVEQFRTAYVPDGSVLSFVGDIDAKTAIAISNQFFGRWRNPAIQNTGPIMSITGTADSFEARKQAEASRPLLNRILVIDLPQSGQAAVSFVKHLGNAGRVYWDEEQNKGEYSDTYFPGIVMNSILGGGYSSRLNLEIRIKRGLSYGASSSINWRSYDSRFSARIQTKNESAAEVAELTLAEIRTLSKNVVSADELTARKAVLIGGLSRGVETNSGLTSILSGLYTNSQSASDLNLYIGRVTAVTGDDVRLFVSSNLMGGDIIIIGDYSIFKDDLAKRFPGMKIDVIKADDLDLSKDNLRK